MKLTTKQAADRLCVDVEHVRDLINSNGLAAIDVSLCPGRGKPRWRIEESDLLVFEESRKTRKPVSATRGRQRNTEVIEFF